MTEVLESILRGVMLANDAMAASSEDSYLAVGKLQFVEWHFDLALEARRALESIRTRGDLSFNIEPGLLQLEGGQRRMSRSESEQWWTSLRIAKSNPDHRDSDGNELTSHLQFTVGGGLALGVSEPVDFDQAEIERVLKPIVSDLKDGQQSSQQLLFELLVPGGFKNFAAQQRNLILELDPSVAFIPWELLVDRLSLDSKPMAVSAGLLRRIIPDNSTVYRLLRLSESRKALVIGNPPANNSGFASLGGAQAEAAKIAEVLSTPVWQVKQRIYAENDDGLRSEREIKTDVLTGDYQILHLAAHGVYIADHPQDSGVVIGEDKSIGQPLFFQPRHVKSLRAVPSLVFLNCCHTGSIDDWKGVHHLSASLSAEFIKAGAKAVVAASWAIDDADAQQFATIFYQAMLAGSSFGEAVREARASIYRANSNTWAAFQCYGDPGFTLAGTQRGSSLAAWEYFHEDELVADLENLRSEMRGYKKHEKRQPHRYLREKLLQMESSALASRPSQAARWADNPKVICSLALAFGEMNALELAEPWLLKAFGSDSSQVSLESVLLVRNYLVRFTEAKALQLVGEGKRDSEEFDLCGERIVAIAESLQALSTLTDNSATLFEHIGSAWKLSAMIRKYQGRTGRTELGKSTKAYLQGVDCHRQAKKNISYPGSNAILLHALWHPTKTQRNKAASTVKAIDATRSEIQQLMDARGADHQMGDVWDMLESPDFAFSCWVENDKSTASELQDIWASVGEIVDKYGSPMQLDSVLKQYRFASLFLPSKRKAMVEACIKEQQEASD